MVRRGVLASHVVVALTVLSVAAWLVSMSDRDDLAMPLALLNLGAALLVVLGVVRWARTGRRDLVTTGDIAAIAAVWVLGVGAPIVFAIVLGAVAVGSCFLFAAGRQTA